MMASRTRTSTVSAVLVALSVFVLPSAAVAGAENIVVDLSIDLETAPLNTEGGEAITAAAAADPEIRRALVLEHGTIVADYVRDGVDPEEPFPIWAVTKSWMGLLSGMLIESNKLSLDNTLGDIFADVENAWSNATDVDVRKAVAIRDMLTMSSGLIDSATGWGDAADGGDAGGVDLPGSLGFPDLGDKGSFSYLASSNILSYVIQERTGMSPREYAAENIFPALGISADSIDWHKNKGGMEYAYHGLTMTAHDMAKFGQMYLQEGLVAPGKYLISADWVAESTSSKLKAFFVSPDTGEILIETEYGYFFWIMDGNMFGNPAMGEFYCALGSGGQDICVSPSLDRVSIQQRDFIADPWGGSMFLLPTAFDPAISFEAEDSFPADTSDTYRIVPNTRAIWPISLLLTLPFLSLYER